MIIHRFLPLLFLLLLLNSTSKLFAAVDTVQSKEMRIVFPDSTIIHYSLGQLMYIQGAWQSFYLIGLDSSSNGLTSLPFEISGNSDSLYFRRMIALSWGSGHKEDDQAHYIPTNSVFDRYSKVLLVLELRDYVTGNVLQILDSAEFKRNRKGELCCWIAGNKAILTVVPLNHLTKGRSVYLRIKVKCSLPAGIEAKLIYDHQFTRWSKAQSPWIKRYSTVQSIPGVDWDRFLLWQQLDIEARARGMAGAGMAW